MVDERPAPSPLETLNEQTRSLLVTPDKKPTACAVWAHKFAEVTHGFKREEMMQAGSASVEHYVKVLKDIHDKHNSVDIPIPRTPDRQAPITYWMTHLNLHDPNIRSKLDLPEGVDIEEIRRHLSFLNDF